MISAGRSHVPSRRYLPLPETFEAFCTENGVRPSAVGRALSTHITPEELDTPVSCVTCSTPPQEGKTTWIVCFLAWILICNPWLQVVYSTYNQLRANAVSRRIRELVAEYTPLREGASSVQLWQTQQGGGLLAVGRGSAMTGFRSDCTVIDDPIKDMQEAQSPHIREQTVEWFQSVVMTRMAPLSLVVIIATRWHKDDLIAYAHQSLHAPYLRIPAQAGEDDILGREPGEWLESVQNRSVASWEAMRQAVGSYTWQALYQGEPLSSEGAIFNTERIDIIPWEQIVSKDERGMMYVSSQATVIQSWDLTFGVYDSSHEGDYVAGHVYALIGRRWILVDRVHSRLTFTQTCSQVLSMAARWPQTSRIYVERAANGAALIDALRARAGLITPVTPRGSKEVRALAVQPIIDSGHLAVVDAIYDPAFFQELHEFPLGKHDDDVDALTQALSSGTQDYIMVRSV